MTKYILDCDTGVDDTLAIALGVALAEEDVLAVISTYGMAPLAYTNRNTKYVLNLLNKSNIPAIPGASAPLSRERKYGGTFHGYDGVGNVLGNEGIDDSVQSNLEAIVKIIQGQPENEIVLITTGPVTTLAMLLKHYPNEVNKLKNIVIMGGAVTTEGNSSIYSEANISIDPEAANFVLTSEVNKTLVPLDVTRKTLLEREKVEEWLSIDEDTYQFFGNSFKFYLEAYKKFYPYLNGCALHDPLAVAIAIEPSLVKTALDMNLRVDTEEKTKGWTIEDLNKINDRKSTKVILDIHVDKFHELFLENIQFEKINKQIVVN